MGCMSAAKKRQSSYRAQETSDLIQSCTARKRPHLNYLRARSLARERWSYSKRYYVSFDATEESVHIRSVQF